MSNRAAATGQFQLKWILSCNSVNALQVVLAAIFQILLARYFGASLFTDAYLVSIIMLDFISTLGAFSAELFIQHYNDLRVKNNPDEAKRLYQVVFNLSLLVALAFLIITIIMMSPMIRLFAPGFDAQRLTALKSLFGILTFGLICKSLIGVNNSLLNAEMKFVLPYWIALLTPGFNILSLLLFAEDYGISCIGVSIVLSGITGLGVQQVYISRALKIQLGYELWHPKVTDLIRQTLSLKIGQHLWDLKDPVTAYILSLFPTGTVSLYFYGARLIHLLFGITNAQALQIFHSMVSRLVAEREFLAVRTLFKRILLMTTGVFVIALTVVSVILPQILPLLLGVKFTGEELRIIHLVFLALIPFYVILSIESPLVNITIAMKQSVTTIKIGAIFIIVFAGSAFLLKDSFGIYAIPVALMVAQMQNLIMYGLNVRQMLRAAPGCRSSGAERP